MWRSSVAGQQGKETFGQALRRGRETRAERIGEGLHAARW